MFVSTAPETPAAVLLDVRAVAARLACSSRHIYRMADAGMMPPPRRLGALVRWSVDDLDRWLADGCPRVRPLSKGGAR